jgi:pimeloyl-ACP methyl ester carboxylesterase
MDIILIPGFWLDGSSWDQVVPVLDQAGHRTHPLTLPGMESKETDRSKITLRDHVDAVVDVIDSLGVSRVVYVDSWPTGPGRAINAGLPAANGEVALPDWSQLDDEDLVDLDDDLRAAFRARAIPSPEHVVHDPQQLSDERRYDVPVTVIACEYPSAQLRAFMAQGEPTFQELAKVRDVSYVDLPTGHWPQFTRPEDLARTILAAL